MTFIDDDVSFASKQSNFVCLRFWQCPAWQKLNVCNWKVNCTQKFEKTLWSLICLQQLTVGERERVVCTRLHWWQANSSTCQPMDPIRKIGDLASHRVCFMTAIYSLTQFKWLTKWHNIWSKLTLGNVSCQSKFHTVFVEEALHCVQLHGAWTAWPLNNLLTCQRKSFPIWFNVHCFCCWFVIKFYTICSVPFGRASFVELRTVPSSKCDNWL